MGPQDFAQARDQINRQELMWRLEQGVPSDTVLKPFPGIVLYKTTKTTDRFYDVTTPACCMIAQGAKEIYLGGQRFRYDAHHFLLATLEMPVMGRIVEASPEKPYLAIRVEFDPALIGSVMLETGMQPDGDHDPVKVMGVSPTTSGLLDAALRIAQLLDNPRDLAAIAPLIKREVVYKLLTGEQGARLRRMPFAAGHTSKIAEALERLRKEFHKPLNVDDLARELGMSPTRFYHHFKAITELSPLQFQKQLRLQEARRIMLDEDLDAASAGFRVGYSDPSHFNRDYKRFFGHPPVKDVNQLRVAVR